MSDEETRKWVATWRTAGVELAKLHREELRAFVFRDHADDVDSLLELGARFARPRKTSGLVEQQRLFRKLSS